MSGRLDMLPRFADDIEKEIRQEVPNFDKRYGWRLLYSPVEVLDGANVAFVGLNPGGTGQGERLDLFAMPSGESAYRDEVWSKQTEVGAATLQRQALKIFDYLDVAPHEVLAGNIVPFRTPKWSDLKGERRERALRFGTDIWTRIFERARPSIVISFGGSAGGAVSKILKTPLTEEIDSRWGKIKIKRGQKDGRHFIALPHLSRFSVFSRKKIENEPFDTVFGDLR